MNLSEKDFIINGIYSHNDSWSSSGYNGLFRWSERDWYSLGEGLIFLENISPVKISEKILFDCGFEQFDYGLIIQLELDKNLQLIKSGGSYYPNIIQLPELSCDEIQCVSLIKIDYVHELQNLYNLLKGEELDTTKLI